MEKGLLNLGSFSFTFCLNKATCGNICQDPRLKCSERQGLDLFGSTFIGTLYWQSPSQFRYILFRYVHIYKVYMQLRYT